MQSPERATFKAEELAVVLSHYDLGIIESITDYPRGSRSSPKAGIVSQRGKFLLKRRSIARAHPDRVRFIHRIQKHLASTGFPVPVLVPTRDRNLALLQIRDYVYELFEFVAGQPFQRTTAETLDAGVVLARLHRETRAFADDPAAPISHGGYHDASATRSGLCSIGSTLSSHDSFTGDEAELATLIQHLLSAYDQAAETVNAGDPASLPLQIIHSDWHPGNLLFRNDKVAAVIDYDTLRVSHRILDAANGALQFSMLAGGDPAAWPEHLDEQRFRAFLKGYESLGPLAAEEKRIIPGLMMEALIAECVPPITETGSMGRWAGYRVLRMIRRKIDWLALNGERLMRDRAGP